jgi:diadenosine tetraphosphate (Ap4A) HIT family hydrolase
MRATALRRATRRDAREFRRGKLNYEIHGNSVPPLHAHVLPRFPSDRFVGGPSDGRAAPVRQSPHELERLTEAIA